MTLILGAHLLRRIWLVCDTRATYPDGAVKDDLLKSVTINKQISVVAAGKSGSASYILAGLKKMANKRTTITDFKEMIDKSLPKLMRDYVNATGQYGDNAFIIGGFNPDLPKMAAAGRVGDLLSLGTRLAGEGVRISQSLDPELTKVLTTAIRKNRGLPGSHSLRLKYPHSEVLTLKSSCKLLKYDLSKVGLYKSVLFHSAEDQIEITLPDKLIYELEFRDRGASNWEQQLSDESLHLYAFVKGAILEHKLAKVGGVIFPAMVTPDGIIFISGTTGRIDLDGAVEQTRIDVVGNDIKYELPDGQRGTLRKLEEISDPGEMEL